MLFGLRVFWVLIIFKYRGQSTSKSHIQHSIYCARAFQRKKPPFGVCVLYSTSSIDLMLQVSQTGCTPSSKVDKRKAWQTGKTKLAGKKTHTNTGRSSPACIREDTHHAIMSLQLFACTKLAFELIKFLPEGTLGENKLKRPATCQELLPR